MADLCYLQPEAPPQSFHEHPRDGYNWDECDAGVVLGRMTVRDGRLVLPDGMSYRLLVLPETATMTPALLGKVKSLVAAGATVVGSRPNRSPGLGGYPECDALVQQLAAELWADCDGKAVKEHRLGQGRIVSGIHPERVLAAAGVLPDFQSSSDLRFLHRTLGDSELYFVSNPNPIRQSAVCSFRVTGKAPEFWCPESGRMELAAVYSEEPGVTRVLVPLEASGSVFVVFRNQVGNNFQVASVRHDGKAILTTAVKPAAKLVIGKAVYGVPGDPARTRDVRAQVQHMVDAGADRFEVARMAAGDDPAFGVVKTLVVEYAVDGLSCTAEAKDPETIVLAQDSSGARD